MDATSAVRIASATPFALLRASQRYPWNASDSHRPQRCTIAESPYAAHKAVAPPKVDAKGVTAPIVGATKEGHIAAAVAAMDLGLTEDEVARLEAPYLPKSPVGVETTVPRNWSLSVAGT